MALLQITSPLNWPTALAATERLHRQNNPTFQMNMQEKEAVIFIEDELERTPQVVSAVLSCDAINVNSSAPTQYLSKNVGASLKLTLENSRHHIGCDRWVSLAHNIYVLHLALRYFRQLEEWGIAPMNILMGSLTDGTAGSSTLNNDLPKWQLDLGLGPTATLEDANNIYRARAKLIGESDTDQLQKLNIAIAQARQNLF